MSTAKERLQQKIQFINEFEAIEALDFIEYVQQKRKKEFEEALKSAPVDDEPLTKAEIQALKEARKDLKAGQTLSCKEVWLKNTITGC